MFRTKTRSRSLLFTLFALALPALSLAHATGSSLPQSNPGVVQIQTPGSFSKIYAISDVHGMYDALVPLLQTAGIINQARHWVAGNALLVVVGDSIDKGPKSLEVLDLWISLAAEAANANGRLLPLLGNHEAEFLANPNHDKKAKALIAELQARGLGTAELTDPSRPWGAFLRSEPAAARIGNWLFCHAGFLGKETFSAAAATARSLLATGSYGNDFLIGPTSLLEAKGWWEADSDSRAQMEASLDQSGLFGVVFGHQPSALNVEGDIAQSDDSRLIKIDSGMAPKAGAYPGTLLVFENPSEMKALAPPRVSVIHSGSTAHLPPQSEIPGAPVSDAE